MQPPTLSVIIPTFNRCDLVVEAIASVIAATGDVEVVVVDDGSTDGTTEAVRATFGDRVQVVVQRNLGRSAARNAGVAACQGLYVCFLDSDDVCEPWHFEQFEARRRQSSGDSAYAAPVLHWDPQTGRTARLSRPPSFPARGIREQCLIGMVLPLEGLFVPRSVFSAVGGFDEALRGSEDWEFLVRLVRLGTSVGLLEAPSIRARIHPGRSMADIDWDVHWRRCATQRILGNHELALSIRERQIVEASTHRYCAARLYEAGRMTEARAELAEVRRILPLGTGVRVSLRLTIQTRARRLTHLARGIRSLRRRRR